MRPDKDEVRLRHMLDHAREAVQMSRWKMLTWSGIVPIMNIRNCREALDGLTKYTAGPFGARMIPPGTLI